MPQHRVNSSLQMGPWAEGCEKGLISFPRMMMNSMQWKWGR